MTKKKSDPVESDIQVSSTLSRDDQYLNLLDEIKTRLGQARLRAAVSVNTELVRFYWDIGKLILERQTKTRWGDKLFDMLAEDLRRLFPGTEGFSRTNLKNMRLFARHYPNGEFGQALPDQLTWTHHVLLAQLIGHENIHIKQWYAEKAVAHGWGYRDLRTQIKNDLYARQSAVAGKTTNFMERLPQPTSRLAHEMVKDPYKFHFLSVGEDAHEKDVHNGLLEHVKQFLMELGHGFALFGTRYPLRVSDRQFEIDLLMYNTMLHCYVVIELKRGDFHPKDTGQLNFYLSAVDDQLKTPEDGQTIGLLLCEKKDRVIAEYALRRVNSPMGISEYELSKSLPPRLNNILPTTDEIETELNEFARESRQENDDE